MIVRVSAEKTCHPPVAGNIHDTNIPHGDQQPLTSLEVEQQKHGRSFGMSLPIYQKVAKNTNQELIDNDPVQPSTSNATAFPGTTFSKSMGSKHRYTKRAASRKHNMPNYYYQSTPVKSKEKEREQRELTGISDNLDGRIHRKSYHKAIDNIARTATSSARTLEGTQKVEEEIKNKPGRKSNLRLTETRMFPNKQEPTAKYNKECNETHTSRISQYSYVESDFTYDDPSFKLNKGSMPKRVGQSLLNKAQTLKHRLFPKNYPNPVKYPELKEGSDDEKD